MLRSSRLPSAHSSAHRLMAYGLLGAFALSVVGGTGCGCGTMPYESGGGSGTAPGGGGTDGGVTPDPARVAITRQISSIALLDADSYPYGGTAEPGSAPTDGTAAPPVLSLPGESQFEAVRGGSLLIELDSPRRIERLYVGVPGQDGFYEVDVASRTGRAVVVPGEQRQYFEPLSGTVVTVPQSRPTVSSPVERAEGDDATHYQLVLSVPIDVEGSGFDAQVVAVYASSGRAGNVSTPLTLPVRLNNVAQASGSFFYTVKKL